jgi:hypothetical protein
MLILYSAQKSNAPKSPNVFDFSLERVYHRKSRPAVLARLSGQAFTGAHQLEEDNEYHSSLASSSALVCHGGLNSLRFYNKKTSNV